MHAGFDIPLIRVSLSVELHRIHMLVGHCPAIGTNVLGDNDQVEVLNEHVITTKNNLVTQGFRLQQMRLIRTCELSPLILFAADFESRYYISDIFIEGLGAIKRFRRNKIHSVKAQPLYCTLSRRRSNPTELA